MRLERAGLSTLLLDLGWKHSRALGVPSGGPADLASFRLGNALVGNDPSAPALEFSLLGPTIVSDVRTTAVVVGAPFEITREGFPLETGKTFVWSPGERLMIGGCRIGCRGYLCIAGGFASPRILGSQSRWAPLQAGEELRTGTPRVARFARYITWPPKLDIRTNSSITILRVLPGAQSEWFPHGQLENRVFSVSPQSNRMGIRLEGDPLSRESREMLSEPVVPGTIQVTNHGLPIILGVDSQTIGGYPKIAQVILADRDRLGQLRPGEQVRFVTVTEQEAREAFLQRIRLIQAWESRLQQSILYAE
jgi:antagonist of KipI